MKRSRTLLFVLGGAAAAFCSASPAASTRTEPRPVDLVNGHKVYAYWCATCHGRGPGHPGTQSLEIKYRGKVPAVLEDRKDLTIQATTYFVRNGVALMPPFRKTEIGDEDLRDLAAYLARSR